ncbi:hypothetical protein [Actinoplanes sp. NPDC049599]|uniref:hypothetical protein n=1 Tax=Actinoplanes sp. NPDC049599 TaxID=3363903 RepID=UPI00378AC0D7
MKILKRLLAVGAAVVASVALVPGAARADTGCSVRKYIPGVSIYYTYCDWQGSELGFSGWSSRAYMENNHGAAETVYTQVNLQIDGKDNILAQRSYYIHEGKSQLDPYGGVGTWPWPDDTIEIGFAHKCTLGHIYFPIVRMKLGSTGTWGQWAGAGKFVCAFS